MTKSYTLNIDNDRQNGRMLIVEKEKTEQGALCQHTIANVKKEKMTIDCLSAPFAQCPKEG